MIANGVRKFSSFYQSSVNCGRVYFIHLKNSRFVEDMFYPKNEVMAFPNIVMRSMLWQGLLYSFKKFALCRGYVLP